MRGPQDMGCVGTAWSPQGQGARWHPAQGGWNLSLLIGRYAPLPWPSGYRVLLLSLGCREEPLLSQSQPKQRPADGHTPAPLQTSERHSHHRPHHGVCSRLSSIHSLSYVIKISWVPGLRLCLGVGTLKPLGVSVFSEPVSVNGDQILVAV